MKHFLFSILFFSFLFSFGQSFQKSYAATYTDATIYKNRLYVLVRDSGAKHCVVKKDLEGNIIWSKKFGFTTVGGGLFLTANAGKISITHTGGSTTPFISIDTLNGSISTQYAFFPCPPNPQNKSDRVIALNNGVVVKLGCNPMTLQQTIYTTNSITGSTIAAMSITTPTNIGSIGAARIAKSGPNSVILYGRMSSTNLMFFVKITNPVTMANTGIHILKKQLPFDLDPDFGTDVDTVGSTIFALFRNNNTYTYVKTDTSLSSFTSFTRPINNNFVSHVAYKNGALYSGVYNVTSSITCVPILSSVNNNFTTVQTVSYPPIPITNTGTATYPNRDFKVSCSGGNVYFAYHNSNNLTISKSNNFGSLNCTGTTTLPSFSTLLLVDSLVSSITATISSFVSYANTSIQSYSSSVYSHTISCISVGVADFVKHAEEVFTVGQLSSSDYLISATSSTIKALQVFDIAGNLILNLDNINSNKTKINLSNYSNGIYILKATSSEKSEKVFKLLKL
ncbi:MAG: T9SS type A sorting domain-containing protein [Bacteroidota bacterium]|nr:T9SS type A sorting domain-containing protein [Bacteroidota bacterium]